MCGIVGLFAKTASIEANLGSHLANMLIEMTERGPDSAGIAVYRNPVKADCTKLTVLAQDTSYDWGDLEKEIIEQLDKDLDMEIHGNHALLIVNAVADDINNWFILHHPELHINSSGTTIEIYKDKGLPENVLNHFNVSQFKGTHALGHTRMATESAVTTQHSHPFSTGQDLCLVHNGSLSNHNNLREQLQKQGIVFRTDNDSEVAAAYLTHRMQQGDSLDESLQRALKDLDGFYTFAIGTRDGFAVLRDPIACKPAVMAETNDWVAMASEYRAIAVLPDADNAECWEPEPAKIYSWSH
ncbi:MAG: glutamine amidotransferase family protein [Proteobacteria bacterium]|nr:glutamine amidotransferase family protein [Pseudomonadota bacterium]